MPRGANQVAVPRSTEGPANRVSESFSEKKRGRGRPKGSKNKAKQLIPADLANELLIQMKDTLPPEHYDYIRGAIRDGKAISTKHEAQVMLLILGRNLLPAILEESRGTPTPEAWTAINKLAEGVEDEIERQKLEEQAQEKKPVFRKDVGERLKVWASILNIVHQMEKNSDDESNNRPKPIFEIFARRGIDGGRIKVLAGFESGDLGRDPDETGGRALSAGAVPSERPDGQIDVQDFQQGEADWTLDSSFYRDLSRGDNEDELQGEHSVGGGEGG